MPTNVFCNQLIYIPLTPLSACSSFPAASMLRYPMKHLFTPHFHPTNPGYPSQSHLLIQALFSGEGLCLSWLHPYVSTPHPCPLLILPLILSSSSPHPLLIPSSYSPRPLLILPTSTSHPPPRPLLISSSSPPHLALILPSSSPSSLLIHSSSSPHSAPHSPPRPLFIPSPSSPHPLLILSLIYRG